MNLSILLRWKRSIYKLLWKHMLVYAVLYILITVVYDHLLSETGKRHFRVLADNCLDYSRGIDLMIVLGFFTWTTMNHSMKLPKIIPTPSEGLTFFVFSLKSDLPEGAFIIEQYFRWKILSWIFTFHLISEPLRSTFPDFASLQASGLLTEEDKRALEKEIKLQSNRLSHLVVFDWMLLLLKETYQYDRFLRVDLYEENVRGLIEFKKQCERTVTFTRRNIPPSVIQAVIVAVYSFGIVTLMSRRFPNENDVVTESLIGYFPFMPTTQFFIYFAWLCFGIAAVDPFGDDDDSINVKELLHKHVQEAIKLKQLYNRRLQDVFPYLPQSRYNELDVL